MKKIYPIFILFIMVISCQNEYSYVQINKEKSLFGDNFETVEKSPEVFKAENDSVAYLEAYSKFQIGIEANKRTSEIMGELFSTVKDFKLLNSEGEDITLMTSLEFDFTKGKEEIEMFNSFFDDIDERILCPQIVDHIIE